ncbi:MAG: hypothetical protein R8N23_11240 [Reichenbachiella sp.]|uniref:hypothetical protein n=1 Tax=Reichenbachiella sp. TaxID=2184521 RepID=UPI00296743A2|nr:hypothetical protein [Reichenbachiella sp.]MDW3210435.1 hypothetical protein [Reichenbachiella sp.]
MKKSVILIIIVASLNSVFGQTTDSLFIYSLEKASCKQVQKEMLEYLQKQMLDTLSEEDYVKLVDLQMQFMNCTLSQRNKKDKDSTSIAVYSIRDKKVLFGIMKVKGLNEFTEKMQKLASNIHVEGDPILTFSAQQYANFSLAAWYDAAYRNDPSLIISPIWTTDKFAIKQIMVESNIYEPYKKLRDEVEHRIESLPDTYNPKKNPGILINPFIPFKW